MIDAKVLLADLTRLLKRLEDDLRERALSPASEVPELCAQLQAEWKAARDAERTAETFESWVEQVITQAGVHWLLSCVFLRFIEDNELVERPWIGGTPQSGRLALARDRHDAYFREQPHENDRDYLIACFREAGALPGLHTFFDEAHNPVFRLGISGDAAMLVMQFWQEVAADSGALIRDFTDPTWNTRFLGDLYQDLSEATRKRYALLQTPEFVEEFILDRTLTPAIHEFGYREVRMIDPTCGSGHFLLGGFLRLVEQWSSNEPGRNRRDIAQKALDAVAGVDLNPFAIAIARFRLFVGALQVAGISRLANAPDFRISVAIGDSLLHGTRFGLTATQGMFEGAEHFADTGLAHAYASEDLAEVQRILGRQYHAVVGNPPYIVVKDAALNRAYRGRYASCHMKYSLGCPFTERFFELAVTGKGQLQPAGFVGLITTNSFMKRDFGVKLVEQVFPNLDLTHVVDSSRAHIPEHGTPTVILFGRHRRPTGSSVRVAAGVTAEETRPANPSLGRVWLSLINQLDHAGSKDRFVEVSDFDRMVLNKHPWSFGSEEITELKRRIEDACSRNVGDVVSEIGFGCVISEEEAFLISPRRLPADYQTLFRPTAGGDAIRDWTVNSTLDQVVFPYDENIKLRPEAAVSLALWPYRTLLSSRKDFGNKTYFEAGRPWWEYHQIPEERNRTELAIALAFVGTHNHFVLAKRGVVFGRTAPIIILPSGSTEEDHLGLTSLLNSSVACFWLKRVLMDRGGGGIGGGLATEPWERFYEHDGRKVMGFPLIKTPPVTTALQIQEVARLYSDNQPSILLRRSSNDGKQLDLGQVLQKGRQDAEQLRQKMISLQEELDWECYRLYGLLPTDSSDSEYEFRDPPEVRLGERAFEIALARRLASGSESTTWFDRHGSTPITDIPSRWPEPYRRVVQLRLDLIECDRSIGLIECAEYKRRWNTPDWETLERNALRDWLLARLEQPRYWMATAEIPPQLNTTNRLADVARGDAAFMQVAALYAGYVEFDPAQVVAELVTCEAVPLLPIQRYTESGLRKYAQWEQTWILQRRADAGDAVGPIPVPPKYKSTDFVNADFWRLRGKLDVPKERWISFPGAERGTDGSLVIAWAGWNHLQQAMALATYFIDMKEREGWSRERLQPLLTGLLELVPWLKQWHNDMNPDFGARMGDYYESFVTDEARALQFTLDDLRAWKPAVAAAKRGRKKAA